jgi:hypothetical protein
MTLAGFFRLLRPQRLAPLVPQVSLMLLLCSAHFFEMRVRAAKIYLSVEN